MLVLMACITTVEPSTRVLTLVFVMRITAPVPQKNCGRAPLELKPCPNGVNNCEHVMVEQETLQIELVGHGPIIIRMAQSTAKFQNMMPK